jgi:2',3'-cyclic-nucleotide 2'-phosphodiesterase (5'-nucleotidase family)
MLILVILYLTTFVSSRQIPLQAPLPSPLSAFTTTTSDSSSFLSSLPKPSRPLQWGTLNILSTTDIHGWLRGHTHHDHIPESLYSGSIADVASFREHMQAKADQLGVDLLLVDSGDVVDGNGFVDADNSGFKGHAARELLKLVEYDIATTGNHEVSEWSASERA